MRRLDAAKAKLDTLQDRDAILDCFFDHASTFFQFSVLFVVRGETAQGRNVHGIGSHDNLVSRLALPLTGGPGILQRARDHRRPFVVGTTPTEADALLFGSLGRALPYALAVPVVLRDRVVAILLGDTPTGALHDRAREVHQPAVELAKDEMLVWTDAASNALERIIRRRKGSPSAPPTGPVVDLDVRRPAPLPSIASANLEDHRDVEPIPESTVGSVNRRIAWLVAGVGMALALAAAGFFFGALRPGPEAADRVLTSGNALADWPHVDPVSVIDAARAAAGSHAELARITAELGNDGRVDFTQRPVNLEAVQLGFVFVTPDAETDVRVDEVGVHAPHPHARRSCGARPCGAPVPAPACSFAKIREAGMAVGLGDDRALYVYADQSDVDLGVVTGPRWTVTIADRGSVHFDAATCKPVPRERWVPAPVPLAQVKGAPREVDPEALLVQARRQAGLEDDAVVLEIDAHGVASTGKIDVTTGEGGTSFTFIDPPTISAKSRRLRIVQLDTTGLRLQSPNGAPPQSRETSADPRPPQCSLAHAYRTAGTAPAGALASIRYMRRGDTAQFEVVITSANLRRAIGDEECAAWEKLVRK